MVTESVVVDVSQDWVAACGLQERFMEIPCAKSPRLTSNGRCRQMRAVGGDCFHFVPLPGRRIGLAVADASGKGLPAALIAANVQSSLPAVYKCRAQSRRGDPPRRRSRLARNLGSRMFVEDAVE
jgi:hypothetical protein